MKLAAVAMIKDECDIVELFIKINSRVFDSIVILDHMSTDGTSGIIKKLQTAGYPVNHIHWGEKTFDQTLAITASIRHIANSNAFDYIVPIDADEFLASSAPSAPPPREVIESCISRNQFGIIPWKTYCPISGDYYSSAAPLYENFRMRKTEPIQFHKVVVGNEYAKNCIVFEGNHTTANEKITSSPVTLPLILQHVPVRSQEQIIRKSILGSHTLALKRNRRAGEGLHWELMAKTIRDDHYRVTEQDLATMAFRYATTDSEIIIEETLPDAPRIGTASDSIEFKDLAHINLLGSFDSYIGSLVSRLNESPQAHLNTQTWGQALHSTHKHVHINTGAGFTIDIPSKLF